MKRIGGIFGAAVLSLLLFGGCAGKEEGAPLTLFDSQGRQQIAAAKEQTFLEDKYGAYWEIVLDEATDHLAAALELPWEEARTELLTGGYSVHTALDQVAFESLTSGNKQYELSETGMVLTDLQGRLLAVSSTGGENFAGKKTKPYSSLKPLSVYAPALEQGSILWNSRFEDSPYKELVGEDGTPEPWPSNSTNSYSYKPVKLEEAVRRSTNTVAVKCLADLGMENSMAFLEALGIDLQPERSTALIYGTEEILGNIALGYLDGGVSPLEMAGYYQMFATGGKYQAPASVLKLSGPDQTLWEWSYAPEQVISPLTAELMNRLLQGVASTAGTGAQAEMEEVQVAGKTGTGDDNIGNWFVGVTPSYCCAVWHGQNEENQADGLFAAVMEQLYRRKTDGGKQFTTYVSLQQVICCAQTGLAIGSGCSTIEMGYFAPLQTVPVCNGHGS